MAKPQLEDGHTQIANEILEALMRIYLPPNQWQVLMCIIRKTYGFKKKSDWIANSQIAEATGLVASVVSRSLKSLEQQKLILRQKQVVGFQKDWELWEISRTANSEKLAEPLTEISSPAKKSLAALLHTKEKKKKLIQKKEYGEFKNVFLTDEEHQKLIDALGKSKTSNLIEQLSSYLESKGKDKYKSHYATLLNWNRRSDGTNKNTRKLPKIYDEPPTYND